MCNESFVLTEFIVASQYIVLSSLSLSFNSNACRRLLFESQWRWLLKQEHLFWNPSAYSPQRIWKSSAFILYTPNVYA